MEITFYGHACFSIKTKGKTILFDPFISPNPKAKSVDVNKLTPDYILISHGHEDHLADAETIAKNADATLVSNFEIVTWYQKKGITKVHPMNHGGSWSFDFGTVKYTNAVHSSMMPDGSYGGNPGGFLIKNDEISFYYSGDTALTMDMKLIENSEKLDIASDFINCNKIIGVHYDTFGYIEINHKKAIEKFKAKGKELILLNIGQELEILR